VNCSNLEIEKFVERTQAAGVVSIICSNAFGEGRLSKSELSPVVYLTKLARSKGMNVSMWQFDSAELEVINQTVENDVTDALIV